MRYYDIVTTAGVLVVGQPDTLTRLLNRLDIQTADLEAWKNTEVDSYTQAQVNKELARLKKLAEGNKR